MPRVPNNSSSITIRKMRFYRIKTADAGNVRYEDASDSGRGFRLASDVDLIQSPFIVLAVVPRIPNSARSVTVCEMLPR